jgi:Ras-related protein Rab-5C
VDLKPRERGIISLTGYVTTPGSYVLQERKLRSCRVRHYTKRGCSPLPSDPTDIHSSHRQASLDKARSWIRELQRQADPSIIIALCGNKTDLSSRRQVTAEEAQKYAEEEGLMWCEASAKTGEGVQDVFMAIAKKLPLSAPQSQKGAAAARSGGAGRGGGVDLSKQTSAPDGCNC